jgi:hypothetical protein
MLTRVLAGASAAALACAAGFATPAAAAASHASAPLPSGALGQLIKDITQAHTLSTGKGVTVAVVSTGVDPADPSIKGKVITGPDFAYKPRIPLSREFGTIAAALIAGSGPSGSRPLSTSGVAPDARILSVRVYPESNEPGGKAYNANYDNQNARGISYAVSHGAQVIFVSAGDYGRPTRHLLDAVQRAVAKKVIIVAAALSGPRPDAYVYPSGIPGVIGVASARLKGGAKPFDTERSGTSNAIFIAGPGNSMGDTVGVIDGPGAAAAVVAGTVALMKSLYPRLTVQQTELALARSARWAPKGGYDTQVGFGMVNPYGALQQAAAISRSRLATGAGVAATSRLAPGAAPATVAAVQRSDTKIIAGAAAAIAGLMLLLTALLAARTRQV